MNKEAGIIGSQQLVRTIRLSTGLKQKEFAFKCNYSESLIALFESGKRTPKLEQLVIMAEQANMSIKVMACSDGVEHSFELV